MIRYADDIAKRVAKGAIPHDVFLHINNAFTAIDITKDIIDNQIITEYEAKREKGEAAFVDSGTIITMLEKRG